MKSATEATPDSLSMSDKSLRSGSAKGGTTNSYSPCIRSTARLVTMIFTSGQAEISVPRVGAAATSCSKLSSTSRQRLGRKKSSRFSKRKSEAVPRNPSASAITGTGRLGLLLASDQRSKGHRFIRKLFLHLVHLSLPLYPLFPLRPVEACLACAACLKQAFSALYGIY